MTAAIRAITSVLAALITITLPTGCDRKPVYRVAVSQCSGGAWRDQLNDEMRREALFADDYHIDIDIRCALDTPSRQIEQLQELAASEPDVIVVSPTESGEVDAAIGKIQRDGIPVVVFDRATTHGDYSAFVGADNRNVGRQGALYAASAISGPIRALELMGNMRTTPARERAAGFAQTADSLPGFTIVARADAAWDGRHALKVADSLLRLHPDINLIFAHNDPMAVSASTVLDSLGMRHRVKVIGVDGSPDVGIRAVMDSTIDATIVYPTLGHEIMQAALALARGEKVSRHNTQTAIPVIDGKNAPMYLMQHQAHVDETANIVKAKTTFDNLYQQHSVQQAFFIATGVITVLLVVILILFLRQYRTRKRLADRLASQNEELATLNAELNDAIESKVNFFTNVSHDLRTPLTLITASVDRVSNEGNLTPAQQTYMRLADKNARILTRLINQILDFNRYEKSKMPLNLCETDIRALFNDFGLGFKALAAERGIEFSIDYAVPSGFSMALDPEKMERIIYNLLSNAFKFTPAGGSITLRAHLGGDGSMLTLDVTDTGRGMSEQELNHLFERHFTSDVANPFGSGIGLTIVQAFVELHGGTVTAHSTEGAGTTLTVTLPVRHIDSEAICRPHVETEMLKGEFADIEASRPAPAEEGMTMLVIDDTKDIREFISQLFGAEYTVLQAVSGQEGLRLAAEYVPDVVICDVMMPGMDGFETTRRLKEDVRTSHIPVLMLTACAMDRQRTQGYAQGADMYLSKPFDPEMLMTMVSTLILNRIRVNRALQNGALTGAAPQSDTAGSDPGIPVPSIESEFYNRFVETVESSMADAELSVEDIAVKMGMSRVQLYRKLKSITNCPPTELLRVMRLSRARRMLQTTDKTVSEVAFEVGFASASYFSKCFREHFGETPRSSRATTKS